MLNETYNALIFGALNAVISYLIGSVSFAVIVSRLFARDDVRKHGSGNAGMTNVLRSYGKTMAAITCVGDFSKGIVAVLFGRLLFSMMGIGHIDGGYISAFFVIVGHMFPIFFGFKGGKGVLTSLGVVLVLMPWAFVIIGLTLIPAVFIVKIVSLIVLIGYGMLPFCALIDAYLRGVPMLPAFLLALFISGLGAYMHRGNIQRLRAGTEYKFGKKKQQDEPESNKPDSFAE